MERATRFAAMSGGVDPACECGCSLGATCARRCRSRTGAGGESRAGGAREADGPVWARGRSRRSDGVNPVDATNRADPSWAGIEPPYVVGYEFAGWIEEVGPGAAQFARGDLVWGMCPVRGTRWGTYADYVELDAGWVGPRPAALDVVEAAAIPLTGSTALQ